MNLTSLYNKLSENTNKLNVENDLPPVLNTDISQYTNILSKKSHLNNAKPLIKENISQPAQPGAAAMPATSTTNDITKILQSVNKKFNSSTPAEKNIIAKILTSLT